MTAPPNPYELLGVARGAGLDEVKRAYRRAVLECHPDRRPGDGDQAVRRFLEVQQAYRKLLRRFMPAATPRELASMEVGWVDLTWRPRPVQSAPAQSRRRRGMMAIIRPTRDENKVFLFFWAVAMVVALLTNYLWFRFRLADKYLEEIPAGEVVLMYAVSVTLFTAVLAATYVLLVLSREIVHLALRLGGAKFLPGPAERRGLGRRKGDR